MIGEVEREGIMCGFRYPAEGGYPTCRGGCEDVHAEGALAERGEGVVREGAEAHDVRQRADLHGYGWPDVGLIRAAAVSTMQGHFDQAMHHLREAVAICSGTKHEGGYAADTNAVAKVHRKRCAEEEGLEEAKDPTTDFSRRTAGDAKCGVFDIADSDTDDPMEYWDEPSVQIAFLESQKSEARCRRMEALHHEAGEEDANSGAAQSPGGCEAIYESFWCGSAEVSSGSDGTLEDDEHGSTDGSFSWR